MLSAGIPTIIKPFFGDQYFWADRVEALGIGSSVRKLTTDHLTAALITATTDTKQISKAKLVGESIRSVGPYLRFHNYRNLYLYRRMELVRLSNAFTVI